MSDAMVSDFEQKASVLNYEETLSVISFLINKLKTLKPQSNAKEITHEQQVEQINSVLAKIPVSEQLEYCDAGLESVREALKNDSW